MMRTGWAAMRQKMMPWMLVEIISSDTPIYLSVLSARVRDQRPLLTLLKVSTYCKDNWASDSRIKKSENLALSFTQKPSKSDGWGQGSEVDEDDGSENLRVQSICVVAEVVAITALQVLHHPTEGIACAGQRVLPRRLRGFLLWKRDDNKYAFFFFSF